MACISDCISTVVQGMTMFRFEGHHGLGSVSEIFEGSIQGLSSWSLILHGGYPILSTPQNTV